MISFPKTNPYLFKILNDPSVSHFTVYYLIVCLRLNMQWNYLYLYTKTTSGWFPPFAQCAENDPNADCALAFSPRLGSLAGQNDSWQAPIPSPLSFDWAALHSGVYCQDPVRWQFVSPFYLFYKTKVSYAYHKYIPITISSLTRSKNQISIFILFLT